MSKGDQQKKQEYFAKVHQLFRAYSKVFTVNVDNVSSSQMHQIRSGLRGKAVVLMGKNTLVRKALREIIPEDTKLEALMPCIFGNIGLVFTNADLKEVRDIMLSNRIQAAAKVGFIAQSDIYIPAGNTGIDPNKTSFFQALGISTKVVKGAIEITSDVLIIKTGQKVGASEAALMNMLNLVPFSFGLTVIDVYDDGNIFSPSMLDITNDVLDKHMMSAIRNIAALSLAVKIPTVASAPHLLINAYKNLLAVGLSSDYSFPAVEKIKKALENRPAAAAAAPAGSKASGASKAAAAAPVAVEEESEEEMALGLFD